MNSKINNHRKPEMFRHKTINYDSPAEAIYLRLSNEQELQYCLIEIIGNEFF